jgi:signal transduction histidine kinase
MKTAPRSLAQDYSLALRDYLDEGGEAGLMRAYQLGRAALADGMGVLEVAVLHQEALVASLLRRLAPPESTRSAQRAAEFFAECLAPFEMTRRGFLEANTILQDLNRELEQRVESILNEYEAARAKLDEQRRLERLKNEFISIVSHELRTPLTSIHGALGLIGSGLGGELSPRARQLLDVAYRNSQRLVRLVDDILDLQKIESGSMPFHFQPLELRPLLEHALEANQTYASALGVSIVLVEAVQGARVYADSDRMIQVMTNLLSNAAKFSPPGESVLVTATREHNELRVAVTDRGPGIPDEFRDRIFQRFAQADSSTTREKGGTGLGLSITKAIVERLGGTISFESPPEGGTTFHFDLPEWLPDPAVADPGAAS